MTDYQQVLEYWLGDAASGPQQAAEQKKLWYRSSTAIDNEITKHFADLHNQAMSGELKHWQQAADSCLALVILLDQFSRHLYRGTPGAFAQDNLALAMARSCPGEQSLPLIGRAFLYHPFEHSENIEAQKDSLLKFKQLAEDADAAWQPMMSDFYQHAQEHHDIVATFGRFPHRNSILGRTNTKDEDRYLAEGGKTFGQIQRP